MTGSLLVAKAVHGTCRVEHCSLQADLRRFSRFVFIVRGFETERCKRLSKQRREVMRRIGLAPNLYEYMRRCRLQKVFASPRQERGVVGTALGTPNIRTQCGGQFGTRQRVENFGREFPVTRQHEAFSLECSLQILYGIRPDIIRRSLPESPQSSDMAYEYVSKLLSSLKVLVKRLTEDRPKALRLSKGLALSQRVRVFQSGFLNAEPKLFMAGVTTTRLCIVHELGERHEYGVVNWWQGLHRNSLCSLVRRKVGPDLLSRMKQTDILVLQNFDFIGG